MKQLSRGFTLIELMVVVVIFAIISAVFAVFAAVYFRNYSFSFEENQAVGLAQATMTQIIREIREARLSETGGWPLSQTDDNIFIFYADVTNDGRTDRVRYFLEGTLLKKGIIEPTQPPVSYPQANEQVRTVADFVDNSGTPLFTYYNGDWPQDSVNNPLAQGSRLLNTRYVSLDLRININPNFGAQPFELTSGVAIRSLKDNL